MAIAYFVLKQYRYGYTLGVLSMILKEVLLLLVMIAYINAIIYFYIAFFISMLLCELIKKRRIMIIFTFIFTYLYIFLMYSLSLKIIGLVQPLLFWYIRLCLNLKLILIQEINSHYYWLSFVFYYVLNVFHPFKYGWMEFKCLMYLAIIDIRNENQTSKSPYGMGRRSFFRNLFSTWTIF